MSFGSVPPNVSCLLIKKELSRACGLHSLLRWDYIVMMIYSVRVDPGPQTLESVLE